MVAQQHKIRLHFLIVLTVVVGAFGATRLVRTHRRRQVRTDYVQTERQLREYAAAVFRAEHEQLQQLAVAERGRLQRDAAALLMQARCLMEQAEGRPLWVPGEPAMRALAEIKANFSRIQDGEPPRFPTGQSFFRGYYAAVDGTVQPYSVCLPKDYNGNRPYPLVITLHGRMGHQRFQCRDAPCYDGAISVKPEGRCATDYMCIGEDDVLAALDEVIQLYNIDRNRVYLVGHSMGATGCWNLAAHHPHLFTGIVAIGGRTDPRAWERLREENAEGRSPHQPVRTFLHASLSPLAYADNLQHCHVIAAHAAGDKAAAVDHTRAMVERLRDLDYSPEYFEFPETPHGSLPAWTKEYAVAKVFGRPAASTPTRFRYRTAHLRHNRAWWIRLDRLDDPVRLSTVTAEAEDGRLDITTDNVSALTVLLDEVPGPVRLARVDGAEFPVPPRAAGPFSIEKWDGQWRIVHGERPAGGRGAEATGLLKRKGLSGPFSDVLRDPFLVVFGTGGESDLRKDISRREAEHFAAEWQARYGDPPRVKPDSEVADEDIANFNLLLFGGPAVNEVSRKVADGLPVNFEDGVFMLGDGRFDRGDMGLLICHPNPLNPERMVAMAAGNSPAALYQAYDRTGLWFNWSAYDKHKWFDYAVFDSRTIGPETFCQVGFFDNQWQLSAGGGSAGGGAAWKADPSLARALVPQAFPSLKSAAEWQESEVLLSDVRPIVIEQPRGAVGFNRSYVGRAIRLGEETFGRGLGVKPPSKLSFALARQFRRFSATVGLTEGFGGRMSADGTGAEQVVFEVWGDGKLLNSSPPLNWTESGRSWARIAADVRGVAVLTLEVRPAGEQARLSSACAWGAPIVSR